jgi:hypothetical protein
LQIPGEALLQLGRKNDAPLAPSQRGVQVIEVHRVELGVRSRELESAIEGMLRAGRKVRGDKDAAKATTTGRSSGDHHVGPRCPDHALGDASQQEPAKTREAMGPDDRDGGAELVRCQTECLLWMSLDQHLRDDGTLSGQPLAQLCQPLAVAGPLLGQAISKNVHRRAQPRLGLLADFRQLDGQRCMDQDHLASHMPGDVQRLPGSESGLR